MPPESKHWSGGAESLRATQRDAAALLTIEAFRLSDTPRTRSALLSTFTDEPRFYDTHRLPGETGGAGIVMPDGVSAYSVDLDGRMRPYGLDDGSLGNALPAVGTASDRSAVLVASPDGRLIAQASRVDLEEGPTEVGIFDAATDALDSRRSSSTARCGRPRSPPMALDLRWRSARKRACSSSTARRGRRSHRARESPCLPWTTQSPSRRPPVPVEPSGDLRPWPSAAATSSSPRPTVRCGCSMPRRSS